MPSRAREQLVYTWTALPFYHRPRPKKFPRIDLRWRPYTPRTVTGAAERLILANQAEEVGVLVSTALDPGKVATLDRQLRAAAESSEVVEFVEIQPAEGEARIKYCPRRSS